MTKPNKTLMIALARDEANHFSTAAGLQIKMYCEQGRG